MTPDPEPSAKEPYKGQPEKQAAYWKERYEIARDENAALRADKARLDWLEDRDQCYWVEVSSQPDGALVHEGQGPTLRAAIDAARKEQP